MSGERERIERLRARLARQSDHVRLGIGDDAAVLAGLRAPVLSVDVSVEGVHFRRAWASFAEIGRRAFVAAASDLAAMGAEPRAALLSLVLPPDVDDEALDQIATGVAEGADETGTPVVGGNLSAGGELSITTTVVGDLPGEPIERGKAREGESLWVTGTVGDAALGLSLLAGQGRDPAADERPFVERWRRPHAQIVAGQRLSGIATSLIDVSDGLLRDTENLLSGTGLGAELFVSELPLSPGFDRVATRIGRDPIELALTGGEDYGLLFTSPLNVTAKHLATRIGHVRAEPGLCVTGQDGQPLTIAARGFDHFGR